MRVTEELIESALDRHNILDMRNLALLLIEERNDLEAQIETVQKAQPVNPFSRVTVAACIKCGRTHLHVSCPRGPSDALRALMERAMAAQSKTMEF